MKKLILTSAIVLFVSATVLFISLTAFAKDSDKSTGKDDKKCNQNECVKGNTFDKKLDLNGYAVYTGGCDKSANCNSGNTNCKANCNGDGETKCSVDSVNCKTNCSEKEENKTAAVK